MHIFREGEKIGCKSAYELWLEADNTTLLVKEVSFDFAAYTMRIQGQKFYPYYPFTEGG